MITSPSMLETDSKVTPLIQMFELSSHGMPEFKNSIKSGVPSQAEVLETFDIETVVGQVQKVGSIH